MSTTELAGRLDETVSAIRYQTDFTPRIGVVLGSGLGGFGERLRNVVKIPYETLPHMPVPTVPGNAGSFYLGFVDDVPVICMEGRVHMYEGYPAWQVVHGARVMARLGANAVLVTNAAGALERSCTLGSMVVIVDHLDFMAHEPIGSLGLDSVSPFPDMRTTYDPTLRDELHAAARVETSLSARISPQNAVTIELDEGIYAALRDPTCETPAQVRMLAAAGAKVMGSSTVPEVTALRQLGVRVAALSYVAYHAAGVAASMLEDETTSRLGSALLHRLVRAWIVRAART
ncbi:MAG: Purine nucleoside phosphorylase [Labilithrix sp.]|nr:Purine nucleoside phosphorylase [Labilithrix sp.]